ncbi:hypothetical protein BDV40DRAFT_282254 [Aspergillus tamarii]|uniref:Uncharacterized protein n=1 Tax=Aspergillus tamarii TaxID=41984 RepID=A0A5N6UBY2_ASPTM|nr:hypothetical protein BDV40DRAFT_282254 [Aspergillus tamarii]
MPPPLKSRPGGRGTLQSDMFKLEIVAFGRSKAQHHILPLMGGMCFDEVYILNPYEYLRPTNNKMTYWQK